MSRIACSWATLSDGSDTDEWYEATHVSSTAAKLGTTARNAEEAEDNVFKEVAHIQGKYMTLYDLPEGADSKSVVAEIQPQAAHLPRHARIDTRLYEEFGKWYGDDWYSKLSSSRGFGMRLLTHPLPDVRDVQMFMTVLWQPAPDVHDDFVAWLQSEFIPGMLESPELLRTRVFKLQHALLHDEGVTKERNMDKIFQYMTIWEFDCHELPWEIMVYLGSSEGWRYYVEGGLLQWQMGQFLITQSFGDDGDDAELPAGKRASIVINGASPVDAEEDHSEGAGLKASQL
jgi:hypothetical protein